MNQLLEFHRVAPPRIVERQIDPDWTCRRSGDCCRAVDSVVMTTEEQRAVMSYAEKHCTIGVLNKVNFHYHPKPNFVELQAGPCPFLHERNVCLVHEVRPYNCRRFGCLRPDVKAERLVMAPGSPILKYGAVGCSNLRERLLQSAKARKVYALLQRKGRRWALSHGWRQDDTDA